LEVALGEEGLGVAQIADRFLVAAVEEAGPAAHLGGHPLVGFEMQRAGHRVEL